MCNTIVIDIELFSTLEKQHDLHLSQILSIRMHQLYRKNKRAKCFDFPLNTSVLKTLNLVIFRRFL